MMIPFRKEINKKKLELPPSVANIVFDHNIGKILTREHGPESSERELKS